MYQTPMSYMNGLTIPGNTKLPDLGQVGQV